ncbi:O-methyltransferase [Mycena olivaceomarginata]|nr:O-methyltransferase [Mycena olivaceomarginata]
MESISTLRLLANIINDAVSTMERVYTQTGVLLPSLDDPFNPDDPAESLRQDKEVFTAVKNIRAAAAQISATVCDPARVVLNTANAFHLSSCLRAASELNIVEILAEVGAKGTSAEDIAAQNHADPGLVARILRILATHHIFREVSPGLFANNRISSTLNKGKLPSEIFSNLDDRLTGSSGVAALVEHTSDICGKAGVYLADTISSATEKLPFNVALGTDDPLFKWMQRPENRHHVKRFATAMKGTAQAEPADLIFQGFDWSLLPNNGVIVDVGGGIGHLSLSVAKRYPHLRVANQDLDSPIGLSRAYWKTHFHTHLDAEMVEFQATSRLVVIERVLPLVAREDPAAASNSKTKDIPGAARPIAALPLLPNWGAATAELYMSDMTMYVMLGGVERTLDGFYTLFAQAGWELIEVHHYTGSYLSQLVASPM